MVFYMFLTLIGGIVFLGSQAWEWKNFIQGTYGAVETKGGRILQFEDAEGKRVGLSDIALESTQRETLERSSGLWFNGEEEITGFHGFHVFTGVLINLIIFFNILLGTYERRGSYEMVEKVGLYWHFVDLVWVFVFTFFYLV